MAVPVMFIDGDVVAVHSHWTGDGSRIVTEATVRTPDGEVVVSQLGGSVDGIGMITMPGPELLVVGMKVAVAAHRDVDLSQREHVVLDTVKVMAYPPGFVRTGPTKDNHYLYWEGTSVDVTIDEPGTASVMGDGEFAAIDAAINEWTRQTQDCSYFKMVNKGRRALEVGRDKINLIKFRDTTWGRPATGDDPARTYSPSAAGLTTAVYVDDATSDRDGAIIDADVELNAVNFAVSVNHMSTKPPGMCEADLQNTLTHELGHLQGLEHPCLAGGDPPRRDNNGAAVPACALTTDMKITEATMYNFQDCGETKKSSLSDDDIAAICTVYSKDNAPDEGCGASKGAGMPGVSVLVAGLLFFMMRRRNSREA